MKTRLFRNLSLFLFLGIGMVGVAPALNIRIRYDHHGGLFPKDSEARVAMRAVCDFYEELITDKLGEINGNHFGGLRWNALYNDPSTGEVRTFGKNVIIPEDDFFLFVGSRKLSGNVAGLGGGTFFGGATDYGPWIKMVDGRGEPGAYGNVYKRTDFGPWGGIVTFDLDRAWDFSLDRRGASGGTSFVSVALHEVAHALGFGVSDSFLNHISGSGFAGPHTFKAYGNRNVPLSDQGHFRDDGLTSCTEPGSFGSNGVANILANTLSLFGTPAGRRQQVLMDPSTCVSSEFHPVLTDVDMAALKDVGWNILEQLDPDKIGLKIDKPTSTSGVKGQEFVTSPTLHFVSQIDYLYQLERSANLLIWAPVGAPVTGDGGEFSLSDPDPVTTGCYYRIAVTTPQTIAQSAPVAQGLLPPLPPADAPTVDSPPARICTDCAFHSHDHDHGIQ